TVRRLAEPAQVDPELLEQLRDAGVVPGARGDYRYNEGYVLIRMDGQEEGLELPVELASHIFLVVEAA
ncbi:MAG: ferrous iron transport protein A, partial [Microbacterium sp.]